MKLLISATEDKINAKIAERFEESKYYGIYDSTADMLEFVDSNCLLQDKQVGANAIGFLRKTEIDGLVSKRFDTRCIENFKKESFQLIIPRKSKTVKDIIQLTQTKK